MISGYKIVRQNNDDVLFLYLDFNYEFGSDFKNNGFFKSIKSFLKNINFNGKKVLIVSSGIIIGTLLINPIKLNKNIENPSYNYVSKIIIHDFDNNNLKNYEITISDANDITESNILENQQANNVNNVTTKNDKKSSILSNNNKVEDNENISKEKEETRTEIKDETESEKQTEEKQEENSGFQIVTVYRSDGSILNIELEEYLIGVVAAEMPASFNIEALKAQAVVARTYTLNSIKNGKKLTDTTSTQVYKSNNELKQLWGNSYEKYYKKIKEAVSNTNGKAIFYNNEYIDAVYHSTINGFTESSENVWGNSIPYLKSVESSWDKNVSSYEKTVEISLEEFYEVLELDMLEPLTFEIIHNDSGRVRNIIINGKSISGTEFRTILKLRSADFRIELVNDKVIITTYGYGHGVGMSQYGANEMAKLGYNYSQIIKHYYTGVVIK